MENKNNNPLQLMSQWLFGFQISQAIHVAAKLNIADILDNGPLPADEIANITNCDNDSVYRLLRTLASINIFEEQSEKVFVNSALSSLLSEKHDSSIKSKVLLYGEEPYITWGKLFNSVQSGQESFSSLYNDSFYAHLYQTPNRLEVLTQYLNQTAIPRINAILNNYDFSSTKKLVDVGGGSGCMLVEVLNKYPHIHGTLFDSDTVIAKTKQTAASQHVSHLEWIAGNFLESIPANADTYFLSHILHSWDDQHVIKILDNCHKAMTKPGKLILIECFVQGSNQFDIAKWMDLNMLVMTNGRERTENEYINLLNKANFTFIRSIPLFQGTYLLEAEPT